VKAPVVVAAICKIVPQSQGDGTESDVVPRNFGFGEEGGLKRFFTGTKIGIEQSGPVKNVYLADGGYIDEGKHLPDVDPRAGFFQRFPHGCFGSGFLYFHETGRKRPLTLPGVDGPPAQQDAVFPFRDGSGDQLGVLVMDRGAVCADMA